MRDHGIAGGRDAIAAHEIAQSGEADWKVMTKIAIANFGTCQLRLPALPRDVVGIFRVREAKRLIHQVI